MTTAAIDWVFANTDWTEVVHTIDPENTPSQAVARRTTRYPLAR